MPILTRTRPSATMITTMTTTMTMTTITTMTTIMTMHGHGHKKRAKKKG